MKKIGFVFVPLLILAVALFCSGALMRKHIARADGPIGIENLWAGPARLFGSGETGAEPTEVFQSVLNSLRSDYVERISDQKKLTYGAIEAMVEALHDPYSQFLTPERRKAVEEAERGQFHGMGAIVLLQHAKHKTLTYERLLIANVLPGSPAEKAGVKAGDVLSRINGQIFFQIPDDVLTDDIDPESVRELFPQIDPNDNRPLLSYKEALDLLNVDGKEATLTINRTGQPKPLELKVALGPTKVPAVSSNMIEPGVGYLALRGFTQGSHTEAANAVKKLSSEGAKSLILDLRDNFGGSLKEAEQVASLFTRGSMGYIVRQKSAKSAISLNGNPIFNGRVVVLVNNATLGTSELVAAALSEQKKSPLVGTTTFGDGLDQTLMPLSDGSAIQLTTGKFLTSAGLDFHQKGIKPTQVVAGPPAKQLEAAVALAKGASAGA